MAAMSASLTIATIEMNKDVDQYLKTNTRFWLVKPSVSLAGITGLETLVSGNYIAASPGDGEPTRKFKALSEEPPLSDAKPGLHLTVKADRLGSLNRGSPVFYKQIQVGQVKSYLLSEDQSTVEIKVYIEPTYASLVRKHTRFWNASGISIDANLSGVKVRSESLSSIVAGGIAFATPENRKDSPPTDPSLPFRLYEDFDAAAAGIRVKVKLTDFEGLQAGRTPVMYKGIQVGSLKTLKVDPDLSSANAELTLDPLAEDYLVQDTQFWVVKPSISLAGITGLEALVKGNYIAIRPGDKGTAPQREFVARAKAPPLDLRSPGLHMVLFTDNLGSLDVGSPILYKQVKVGSVQSYGATQPEPIDDNEDRMGSMRELDFDEEAPTAEIGDEIPPREREHLMPEERVREAGMTGASTADHESTDDDMSPETLIHEDGARDAQEAGEGEQADWDLSIVDEDEIGGGNGLDEAELADLDPIDGNR
jgi:paraquat-inducible protein B